MNSSRLASRPTHPSALLTLAHLLERLERGGAVTGADQYRSVVSHLVTELRTAEPGAALQALLDAYPAVAELYENLNYRHAGLCRSPLEAALDAELQTARLLARFRHPAADSKTG